MYRDKSRKAHARDCLQDGCGCGRARVRGVRDHAVVQWHGYTIVEGQFLRGFEAGLEVVYLALAHGGGLLYEVPGDALGAWRGRKRAVPVIEPCTRARQRSLVMGQHEHNESTRTWLACVALPWYSALSILSLILLHAPNVAWYCVGGSKPTLPHCPAQFNTSTVERVVELLRLRMLCVWCGNLRVLCVVW